MKYLLGGAVVWCGYLSLGRGVDKWLARLVRTKVGSRFESQGYSNEKTERSSGQ